MTATRVSRWDDPFEPPPDLIPIACVRHRRRAAVQGDVARVRPTRWRGGPVLEVELADATGTLLLTFLGRTRIAGVERGRRLSAEGMAGRHVGRLLFMNPMIWLLPCDAPARLVAVPPSHRE